MTDVMCVADPGKMLPGPLVGKVAWAPDYGGNLPLTAFRRLKPQMVYRLPEPSPIQEPPMYFPGPHWAAERAYV